MNEPKTFTLLNIGHRGVGKTTFILGSVSELQPCPRVGRASEYWFECKNLQDEKNINYLLNQIEEKGCYPSATIKTGSFSFVLKQQKTWNEKIICDFVWRDIPGEIVSERVHTEFQQYVNLSHGCCVFIDAYALVNDPNYSDSLKGVVTQTRRIAAIVKDRHLKYPFALILTKFDLLTRGGSFHLGPSTQMTIAGNLHQIINILESEKVVYKQFCSSIPIIFEGERKILNPQGAARPLLWLMSELNKIYKRQKVQDLGQAIAHQSNFWSQETQVFGESKSSSARQQGLSTFLKYMLLIIVTTISLIGLAAAIFLINTRLEERGISPLAQPVFNRLTWIKLHFIWSKS